MFWHGCNTSFNPLYFNRFLITDLVITNKFVYPISFDVVAEYRTNDIVTYFSFIL